jgi:hypothetical protein
VFGERSKVPLPIRIIGRGWGQGLQSSHASFAHIPSLKDEPFPGPF